MTSERTLVSLDATQAYSPDEAPEGASPQQGSHPRLSLRRILLTLAVTLLIAVLGYGAHVRLYDWMHSAAASYGLPDYPKTENDEVFSAMDEVDEQWRAAGALLQPSIEGEGIPSVSSLLAPQVLALLGRDMEAAREGKEVNPAETARLALQPLIDKRIKQAANKDLDTHSIAWKAAKDATRKKETDPTISSLDPPPTPCPATDVVGLLACANGVQLAALGKKTEPPALFFGRLSMSPGIDHPIMFAAWMIVALLFSILILTGAMGALFGRIKAVRKRR